MGNQYIVFVVSVNVVLPPRTKNGRGTDIGSVENNARNRYCECKSIDILLANVP